MVRSAIAVLLFFLSAPVPVTRPDVVSVRTSGKYRLVITRTPLGKLKQVVVSKANGRRMTNCRPWFALLDHEFICAYTGQTCGNFYNVATGADFGDSAGEACANAKAVACDGVINPGCVYVFCQEMTNQVGELVAESGGNCYYGGWSPCDGSIHCDQ
jgi:hypothetical protein